MVNIALSAPVKAEEPFAFETKSPRYRVIAPPDVAEDMRVVGLPALSEIAVNVEPSDESRSPRIDEWAKFVPTYALSVPVVLVKLENVVCSKYGVE